MIAPTEPFATEISTVSMETGWIIIYYSEYWNNNIVMHICKCLQLSSESLASSKNLLKTQRNRVSLSLHISTSRRSTACCNAVFCGWTTGPEAKSACLVTQKCENSSRMHQVRLFIICDEMCIRDRAISTQYWQRHSNMAA